MSKARMDLRLDSEIKELATRASALSGANTVTDFVVQAIREKAVRTMEEFQTVALTNESFVAFWEACNAPPAPNEALMAAVRRHDERINSGEIQIRTAD